MSYNTTELIGPVCNYPLYVKKLFLTFLQGWFSQYNRIDNRFYWTNDFKTTKIVIVDKSSYDTTRTEPRPSIVISRGMLGFSFATMDQMLSRDLVTGDTTYADLVPASVTINCISKNGVEAEELASIVMNALTLFKRELRAEGLHQVNRLSIGQEVTLRKDVSDLYVVVPIQIDFIMQTTIASQYKYYPLTIYYSATHQPETADSTPNPYWEIATKSWFEPTKAQTLSATLKQIPGYSISGLATTKVPTYYSVVSGQLSFVDAPAPIYYIISGQTSLTGPDDGTLPALGSSEGTLTPGYLPKGTTTWTVWYTRGDTLEATSYAITVNGVTKTFDLPGGIYGYCSTFNHFEETITTDD